MIKQGDEVMFFELDVYEDVGGQVDCEECMFCVYVWCFLKCKYEVEVNGMVDVLVEQGCVELGCRNCLFFQGNLRLVQFEQFEVVQQIGVY